MQRDADTVIICNIMPTENVLASPGISMSPANRCLGICSEV